jgi:hypothetical protein
MNQINFEIGDIVKYSKDNNLLNRYIILATLDQELNTKFLKSKKGEFFIENIGEIAENGLAVKNGFNYIICKQSCETVNNKTTLEGVFIDILDHSEIKR